MLFKLKAILSLHDLHASNFLDRANRENAKTNWSATEKNKHNAKTTQKEERCKTH